MKISKVEAFPVRLARDGASAQGSAGSPHRLTEGAGRYRWSTHYPALYSVDFETCLVRVELSDGTEGWGEAQAPLAPQVTAAVVEHLLRPAVEGEEFSPEPERIRELWWRMYSAMRVRGHGGGFMVDGIAGVDLALWSAAAKLRGTVERRVIAGDAVRNTVPAYVSGTPGASLEAKLAFVRRYWEQGFRLFKIYFESDWAELLAQIDAMQAEFTGIQVAVDALWHLPQGREVVCAQDLAERRVEWLECPLVPEDLEGHVELVEASGVRLALGESYRTRFEAKPFLERDIVTYWQPDLGRSGMSETLELAALCGRHGVKVVPHVSIALAPQLHAAVEAAAAMGNCPWCEFNPSVVEFVNGFAGREMFRVAGGVYECQTTPVSQSGSLNRAHVASLV